MPKSFKITYIDKFDSTNIKEQPVLLNSQYTTDDKPPYPQSKIYKSRDKVSKDDFVKYLIEHEMEECAYGRYNEEVFNKYIRREHIHSFQSDSLQLLILNGKKKFVLDFCKKTKYWNYLLIKTIQIDMGSLLAKLPHVKGVWFNFPNGLIRASALMGANIEGTTDFQKYNTEGEISTLSFHFDYYNIMHPIMLVNDGTVVLQSNYSEVSQELDLVLEVKKQLIDGIFEKKDV